VFGSLHTKLIDLDQMINRLDTKDEQGGLNEDERKRRNLFADLKCLIGRNQELNNYKKEI